MTSKELSSVIQALSKDAQSLVASVKSTIPVDEDALITSSGPSLLTLKNSALLFYLQHLVLLTAHRLRGESLEDGSKGALLVRSLIKLRLVLEKIKPVENKMRALLERLLRAAEEDDKRIREGRSDDNLHTQSGSLEVDDVDPLSFRPNIAALTLKGQDLHTSDRNSSSKARSEGRGEPADTRDRGDGIYRPPRVAPVVYDGDSAAQSSRKRSREDRNGLSRNSTLLSELNASMSSNPYEASSTGIGINGNSQGSSARAKALARIDAYEEDNFTRLTMSKKDAKRRRRDEADVALGGAGLSTKRGRVGAGLEEEFGDLLRNKASFDRVKRQGAVQRAKDSRPGGADGGAAWEDLMNDGRGGGKRNAFQKGLRAEKKKSKGRR